MSPLRREPARLLAVGGLLALLGGLARAGDFHAGTSLRGGDGHGLHDSSLERETN